MDDDRKVLSELNARISDAENRGDRDWLAGILAPKLAFQRSDAARTIDDQSAYLQKVAAGGNRVFRRIESIDVYGDRAIVRCVVAVADKEFDNIRLFIRRDGAWKLLAWANEPL
jgi:hypothetical protein